MSFASEEHETTYKYNLKEVTRMLKTKHGDNYMVRKCSDLMLSTLDKIFSRPYLKYFFLFFLENGFDIACKLSPLETICMKFQNLFSWEIF